MRTSVAFIGAGGMGGRMAHRLLAEGYEVHVCERDAAAVARLADAGAGVLKTPQQAARFDVVIIMVANDQQFKEVMSGEEGLLQGADGSIRTTVLVMSTILPDTLRSVAEKAALTGMGIIDAPVSGGLVGAERGTLSIMLGGKEEDFANILPILDVIGNRIFRCGGLGSAQTVKLINNMIGLTSIYVVAEAFDLAVRSNIPLETLAGILEASTGRTFLSENIGTSCLQYASWAASQDHFAALSRISRKDLKLAEELAQNIGVNMPLLSAISAAVSDNTDGVFERWQSLGHYKASA